MTTAVETTTHVLTEQEVAHRKACDYLKGLIMGSKGEISNRKDSEAFQAGVKRKVKVCEAYKDYHGSFLHYNEDGTGEWHLMVTAFHILHNRLRHNRPHTGSVERDSAILNSASRKLKKIIDDVDDATGYDLEVS